MLGAIDTTAITAAIAEAVTVVGTVGGACVAIWAAFVGFKVARRAIGSLT